MGQNSCTQCKDNEITMQDKSLVTQIVSEISVDSSIQSPQSETQLHKTGPYLSVSQDETDDKISRQNSTIDTTASQSQNNSANLFPTCLIDLPNKVLNQDQICKINDLNTQLVQKYEEYQTVSQQITYYQQFQQDMVAFEKQQIKCTELMNIRKKIAEIRNNYQAILGENCEIFIQKNIEQNDSFNIIIKDQKELAKKIQKKQAPPPQIQKQKKFNKYQPKLKIVQENNNFEEDELANEIL